jgi:hypothetical protein
VPRRDKFRSFWLLLFFSSPVAGRQSAPSMSRRVMPRLATLSPPILERNSRKVSCFWPSKGWLPRRTHTEVCVSQASVDSVISHGIFEVPEAPHLTHQLRRWSFDGLGN